MCDVRDRPNRRAIAEFLKRWGQFLRPMVDFVEETELAIDEVYQTTLSYAPEFKRAGETLAGGAGGGSLSPQWERSGTGSGRQIWMKGRPSDGLTTEDREELRRLPSRHRRSLSILISSTISQSLTGSAGFVPFCCRGKKRDTTSGKKVTNRR